MVTGIHIITNEKNIFTNEHYIVPLYQRGYAWEEKHIVQLIDDIIDVPNDSQYYIGSLIVHRRNDAYEVIDGQQRLTTLFLLLNYLEEIHNKEHVALRFDCRAKSNYTLEHINEIVSETSHVIIDDSNIQQELLSGYNIIRDKLKSIDIQKLKNNLCKTVLYRIEVPKHTDLNHYFEIMNTRGEQLEQSDVLKANLMDYLQGDKKWQEIFATIWDACRNIDGYIQMHFPKNIREEIFGSYWNELPVKRIKDYLNLSISKKQTNGYSIKEAISTDFKITPEEASNERNQKTRFESIINFSYFLLHTLRVFVHQEHITSQTDLLDKMLDDKKLVDAFDRVIRQGEINNKPINPQYFVKCFIICLLRTRYLFDLYIIKREYVGDAAQDGEWSLKEICSYGQGGNKKALYKLTNVVDYGRWYNEQHNKDILMLQAAMRVSYTSPKVMHWITKLLIWLTDYFLDCAPEGWIYEDIVNDAAREPVTEFLNNKENFYLGVATPHIVLNYLDFLLWKKNPKIDFDFEFRNSVEHWYPRNPSEGSFPRWEDEGPNGVDRFGNLCLIQRSVNSKFSNLHPSAKKSTFQEMIDKGSLKLRRMSKMTTDDSRQWKEEACSIHEEEMVKLLKEACGMS